MALEFREATADDVVSIVTLLADDPLGSAREQLNDPLPSSYYDAFREIDADPANELVVGVEDDEIVAVLQLTFIPYLTYRGGRRALIEGVRVARAARDRGIGRALFQWCIARARERGCHVVQLTADKTREDAQRFYRSLGFEASHEGMKLHLDRQP